MTETTVTKTSWIDDSVCSNYEVHDDCEHYEIGYAPLIADLIQTHGTDINVLDYGCGPNVASWRLIREGIRHVEAVDTSEEMLNIAMKKWQESINYQKINSAELPYADDYFDAAICCFVLICIHSSDDFTNVLREIYRTVKPGGTLYILDVNPDQTGIAYRTFQIGDTGVVYGNGEAMPAYLKLKNGGVMKIIDTYWARSTYEDNLRSAGFTLQVIECNATLLTNQQWNLGSNSQTYSPYLIFKATKPVKSE